MNDRLSTTADFFERIGNPPEAKLVRGHRAARGWGLNRTRIRVLGVAPYVHERIYVHGRGEDGCTTEARTPYVIDLLAEEMTRTTPEETPGRWVEASPILEGGAALAAIEGLRTGGTLSVGALRYAGLDDADLRGLSLSGLDMRAANLRRADLRDADLSNSLLLGVEFQGADLSRADLRHAEVHGADLRGACLRGADLRHVDLGHVRVQGADLAGALSAKIPSRLREWRVDASGVICRVDRKGGG